MKSRVYLIVCSLFLICAYGILIPELATAIPKPVWTAGRNILANNLNVTSSTPTSATDSVVWTNNGELLRINCTVANTEELIAGDPGKDKVKTFAFNNCVLSSTGEGCTLSANPVAEGLEWPSELEMSGNNIVDTTKGFTMKFEIVGCPGKNPNNAKWVVKGNLGALLGTRPGGQIILNYPNPRVAETSLILEGTSVPVTFTGLINLSLADTILGVDFAPQPSPVWHFREKGEKGEGAEIIPDEPGILRGKGGEQTLSGKVGGTGVEIQSSSVQVKSKVFNWAGQGQVEEERVYSSPSIVKPALKECEVKIGGNNTVSLKGHLMWKWDGETKQLEAEKPVASEQTWDIGFTTVEPTEQSPFVEEVNYMKTNGNFATVTFSPTKACGVLAGTLTVGGSEVGIPSLGFEEWGSKLGMRTVSASTKEEAFLQHFWTGERFQGAKLGLTFGKEPANLTGKTELETEGNEIAVFEK